MATTTPDPLSPLLFEIRADLSERWRRGEVVRVEHYLALHPDLARQTGALLELISSELHHRVEGGEHPALEEYLDRFPQLGDAVRRMWSFSRTDERRGRSESDILISTSPQLTQDTSPPWRSAMVPILPGFEMQEKLGESGMGIVYKARDLRLNQLRAIKFIRAAISDPNAQERFGREAKASARLDHPGVVRIYAMGEFEGELFICMEYLEGGNLQARLRQGALDVRQAAELVRQLAQAVQHAHDNMVLHRDLKPANVLLTAGGVPKVADFGLAKLLDEDDGLTRIGEVMGTASYMAPEQAEGRVRDVSTPADVWALGAILYECLTGRQAFKGEGRSETIELVKKHAPVPPRRLRAEVPAELETICLKCLEKQPEHRYGSARELANDLQAWLDGKPLPIRSRRSRRPLAAAFALVLAVVAASAFFLLPRLADHPDRALVSVQNGREPESQDSDPPQPDVWIPLLERKPDILCWPIPGTTSFLEHKADMRVLKAFCQELGLLALGETTASPYQLAITLEQTPWVGNLGLFFGYGTEGSGDEQTRSYQTLTLHTTSADKPGRAMYIAWKSVFHESKARGGQQRSHQFQTATIPSVTPGQHYLAMTVGSKGLERVALDDQELTRLCATALRGGTPPRLADYKGQFGIYLHGNNGTFSEARYRFHKDPP